jgi:hypothetical protein
MGKTVIHTVDSDLDMDFMRYTVERLREKWGTIMNVKVENDDTGKIILSVSPKTCS